MLQVCNELYTLPSTLTVGLKDWVGDLKERPGIINGFSFVAGDVDV